MLANIIWIGFAALSFADDGASTLAKLKNKARQEGIQLQQLLNLFCQEEFVRRMSRSKYKDHLILKGGFLLYTISEFTTRPTVDADYLLKNYSNDLTSIETLINEIVSVLGKYDFIRLPRMMKYRKGGQFSVKKN